MTHQKDRNVFDQVVQLVADHGTEAMSDAFACLLEIAMKAERDQALGAETYERSESRRGYANGYKPKTLNTRAGSITVQVPKARGIEFYPSSLEKGVRSERALKLAVAEMYVQGVSTRKVTVVMQDLCGLEVSSTQVSRAAQELDEHLEAWRTRPLGEVRYLVLDARYEKVRHGGTVVDCAMLSAIGILPDGHRTILGTSCALSESEVHWRQFLQSLVARGLHGVKFIVSDDHAGLRAARKAMFPAVPWQRCQFHLIRNAMAYVPRISMRSEVAQDLRTIFNAVDREDADRRLHMLVEKYQDSAPTLSQWMQDNVPEGLAVFTLAASHRRRMRTSNALELVHKQIKRRTRVASLFPNEASVLRLVSAVLVEIDEEWQSSHAYLNMKAE
ncbi:MAG TPA: IS256 family transposase [Candidatus Latescibacteria bacterium]|nr:IS256 family transposase [Candidatus Latescibacterota bacterium]